MMLQDEVLKIGRPYPSIFFNIVSRSELTCYQTNVVLVTRQILFTVIIQVGLLNMIKYLPKGIAAFNEFLHFPIFLKPL